MTVEIIISLTCRLSIGFNSETQMQSREQRERESEREREDLKFARQLQGLPPPPPSFPRIYALLTFCCPTETSTVCYVASPGCLATSENRPNVTKKMKTLFALVRKPCDSANSHEGLEVSHEIQRFFL